MSKNQVSVVARAILGRWWRMRDPEQVLPSLIALPVRWRGIQVEPCVIGPGNRPLVLVQHVVSRVPAPDLDAHGWAIHGAVVVSLEPMIEIPHVLGDGLLTVAVREPCVDEVELLGFGPDRTDKGLAAAKLVYHGAVLGPNDPDWSRRFLNVWPHEVLAVWAIQSWIVEWIRLELGHPVRFTPLPAMVVPGPNLPPPGPPGFVPQPATAKVFVVRVRISALRDHRFQVRRLQAGDVVLRHCNVGHAP